MSYCQGCVDKQAALDAANARVKEAEEAVALSGNRILDLVVERDRVSAKMVVVELERDCLLADKQSLDWLEERGRATTRDMFDQDGGFAVSAEGDVLSGTIDAGYEHKTLREAIDAMRLS